MHPQQISEAFSGHRFADAYDHLADDVRWVLPGQSTIEGRQAVVAACESTAAGLAHLARSEFLRFVSVAGDRVAAVDAIGRYVGHDGAVSVVSSADIYELGDDGLVTTITSYAVELDPADAPSGADARPGG